MKKLLLASAFALMGTFVLANETKIEITEEVKAEEAAPCSHWIKVTSCQTYNLCGDNYSNGEEVMEAVDYFDEAKGC
ncbi:hypothetical protein [Chishuiella sp.]|uniref:hypothetical protein n=1 Tax=Chishuiella sp. TaxID=1969467 RepID=UPI0028A5CBC3|nr:hypothetical protein [Chishuiella sp.]